MSLVGQTLGRYAIESEVGHGGMSVVYQAKDLQLERIVAVKVMHTFLAEQPDARERFHREAVAVARLRHPHIIEIYDYSGEDAEQSYIVQELVVGSSLAEWFEAATKEGPLPPETALLIGLPIARSLAHAHANGVIHRDLKPENILVAPDGTLKLTDFGIARMLDNQTMTVTGTLLGSPAYMAPEYIEGYATDERADIFSLGAMLYLFATGRLPFEAPSPHALLKKIATAEFVPPQQQRPCVHGNCAAIISACLERLPEHRYSGADKVVSAIEGELEALGLGEGDELRELLADPSAYSESLERRIAPPYLARGQKFLAQGDSGAALRDFDRLLAIDPSHAEVRKILASMTRNDWRWRVLRAAALGVAGAIFVTGLGVAIHAGLDHERTERESGTPTQTGESTNRRAAATLRDVPFLLEGRGDLFIDGEIREPNRQGALTVRLPPGAHVATFENAQGRVEKRFSVPTDDLEAVTLLRLAVPRSTTPNAPGTSLRTPEVDASLGPQPPRIETDSAGGEREAARFNIANWANVYIDGAERPDFPNHMGVLEVALTPGRHSLRFESTGRRDKTVDLTVVPGQPIADRVIRLSPLDARLRVRGAPNGSVVAIEDGRQRVKSQAINAQTREEPIFVPLTSDVRQRYTVVVRSPSGQEFRRVVQFTADRETTLEVNL